jgi:hypothetical protein
VTDTTLDLSPAMREALGRLDRASQDSRNGDVLLHRNTAHALVRRELVTLHGGGSAGVWVRFTPKGRDIAALLR